MRILLVGGGSGGHITPLIGVAKEIKLLRPKAEVAVISERLGNFNHLFEGVEDVDRVHLINAGKFRRYHGTSFFRHFFDGKTIFLNIRDIFRLAGGLIECLWLLARIRPDIIFVKGGYVGVPVGLVARFLRIPYITHDSDIQSGLTNRILAKKALINAVGMPPSNYHYKPQKMVYVGIPITEDFYKDNHAERTKRRSELDVSPHDFLLLITGGSNGAKRMDKIIHGMLAKLIKKNPKVHVVHQVGKDNEDIYRDYPAHLHANIRVSSFLKPLSSYIAASDAVVSRAGATATAEVGAVGRPLIVIPNPYLSGGHQIKNAELLKRDNSAIVVDEHKALENPKVLEDSIQELLDNRELRDELGERLHQKTKKNASKKIAELLISLVNRR